MSDTSSQGNWSSDPTLGNCGTAVDTRSLSFCSIPGTAYRNNSYPNLALLFYENSAAKVSVLLQTRNSTRIEAPLNEWVDITSQKSRLLPDVFHNTPVSHGDIQQYSNTLYESGDNATFSTPFACATNFSGADVTSLFYTPGGFFDPDTSDEIRIIQIDYQNNLSGPGEFCMYCTSSNLE